VRRGTDGALLYTLSYPSSSTIIHHLTRIGDVDGDGRGDFAVVLQGDLACYSGATGTLISIFSPPGANGSLSFAGGFDATGDGICDVAVRYASTTPGAGHRLILYSPMSAATYGAGLGDEQALALAWQPAGLPGVGTVVIAGAAPGAAGALAISAEKATRSIGGIEILVSTAPGSYLVTSIGFDGAGARALPASLTNPALAGFVFDVQAFAFYPAAPQGVFTSNGLELGFHP
jgi:hypothetical protein